MSTRSLDSIALGVVPKSRPHSGFWNPGLEQEEQVTYPKLIKFKISINPHADINTVYIARM